MNKANIKSILTHCLLWIIYISVYTVMYDNDDRSIFDSALVVLYDIPLKMLLIYYFMYVVIPRTFKNNSLKPVIWHVLITLPIVILTDGYITKEFMYPRFYPHKLEYEFWTVARVFKIFIIYYGLTFCVVSVYYILLILKKQKELFESKSQKLNEELKFLKNQINPLKCWSFIIPGQETPKPWPERLPGNLMPISSAISN